jgi:hypothetical protein
MVRSNWTAEDHSFFKNPTRLAEYQLYVALGYEQLYWSNFINLLEFGKKRSFAVSGVLFPWQTPELIRMAKRLSGNPDTSKPRTFAERAKLYFDAMQTDGGHI